MEYCAILDSAICSFDLSKKFKAIEFSIFSKVFLSTSIGIFHFSELTKYFRILLLIVLLLIILFFIIKILYTKYSKG